MDQERIARACIYCTGVKVKKSPAVLMPFVAKRVFDHEPVNITSDWGMRDLKPGMAYSLCNSIQCMDCGALFLDMRFSDEEMASLYAGYRDEEYTRLREHFEPGYRMINQHYSGRADYITKIEEFLRPFLPPAPALLDWGGDTGINTPLKEQARFVHLYDISNKTPVEGIQAISLSAVKENRYDLVICSQMLEHVSRPYDALREIVSVITPETLVYLEVPYEELMRAAPRSKELYLAKRHWHEHINFFSEMSLRELVKRSGLEVVEFKTINISLGWREACVIALLCRPAWSEPIHD